jgi:glycosyltransferase involved in cell wall biosynthesis
MLPFNVYILEKILENRQKDLIYNTDNIITISKYLKQMLQQLHKFPTEKIQVIYPSPPSFPYVPPRAKDGKIIFTFIGRFTFSKGVINLLKAFREALRRNRRLRLKILGSGPLDWYIKKYIKQARLHPFISYEGSFPYDFFPSIMKDTDVVIVPSLAPEGFGRVAMEAMTCGRTVFVNPVGGLVEQVKEGLNGFCVNCNDRTIFANRILEVADMPREELVEMGRRAREYVLKNFDRNTSARKMIALYRKAVDG